MNLINKMKDRNVKAEPYAPLEQLEKDIREKVAASPRGMADPMHPDVAKLLSSGITAAATKYTEEVKTAARRYMEEAAAYLSEVEKWATERVEEASRLARDVAEAHAEMISSRDKFHGIASKAETKTVDVKKETDDVNEATT